MNSVQDLYVMIIFGFLIMVFGILLINVIKVMLRQKKKMAAAVRAENSTGSIAAGRVQNEPEAPVSLQKIRLNQAIQERRIAMPDDRYSRRSAAASALRTIKPASEKAELKPAAVRANTAALKKSKAAEEPQPELESLPLRRLRSIKAQDQLEKERKLKQTPPAKEANGFLATEIVRAEPDKMETQIHPAAEAIAHTPAAPVQAEQEIKAAAAPAAEETAKAPETAATEQYTIDAAALQADKELAAEMPEAEIPQAEQETEAAAAPAAEETAKAPETAATEQYTIDTAALQVAGEPAAEMPEAEIPQAERETEAAAAPAAEMTTKAPETAEAEQDIIDAAALQADEEPVAGTTGYTGRGAEEVTASEETWQEEPGIRQLAWEIDENANGADSRQVRYASDGEEGLSPADDARGEEDDDFAAALEYAFACKSAGDMEGALQSLEALLPQGNDPEYRKLIEIEILDVLIAAGRYEEATNAVYAFLSNGYSLDDEQNQRIMEYLYLLQEKA